MRSQTKSKSRDYRAILGGGRRGRKKQSKFVFEEESEKANGRYSIVFSNSSTFNDRPLKLIGHFTHLSFCEISSTFLPISDFHRSLDSRYLSNSAEHEENLQNLCKIRQTLLQCSTLKIYLLVTTYT